MVIKILNKKLNIKNKKMAYKHAAKKVGKPMMGSARGKALSNKSKSTPKTLDPKTEANAKSPKSGKKVGDVYSTIKSKSSNKDISLVATPEFNLTANAMPREDGYAYDKIAGSQMRGKAMTSDEMAAQQKGNPIMPNLKKEKYTDSGMNYRDANNVRIKGSTVDEENLSNIKSKSPYRPYVETTQTSETPMRPSSSALPGGGKPGEKLFLDKAAKMVAQH
uniref:Uncharacterized protein n=1 Tax=uncultured marine virus TaxID=186617 RepID=A0A0F7L7W0_9VIRU|nr:hypothetical protein [uncultured marine virus]